MKTNAEFQVIVNAMISSTDSAWCDEALDFIEESRTDGADAITMTIAFDEKPLGWVNLKKRPNDKGFRLALPHDFKELT